MQARLWTRNKKKQPRWSDRGVLEFGFLPRVGELVTDEDAQYRVREILHRRWGPEIFAMRVKKEAELPLAEAPERPVSEAKVVEEQLPVVEYPRLLTAGAASPFVGRLVQAVARRLSALQPS